MFDTRSLKILCTGNPNYPGLPKSIEQTFPNTTFISISAGYDLTTDTGLNKFRELVKQFNVFINISKIGNGVQESLLRIVHEEWNAGHVFNIGSIAEYERWEQYDPEYTKEKKRLRDYSLSLSSEKFKTTHIVAGGFQDYSDSNPNRMDPIHIVNIIKYVLESPINIPLVGIEKIIDKELEEQLHDKL